MFLIFFCWKIVNVDYEGIADILLILYLNLLLKTGEPEGDISDLGHRPRPLRAVTSDRVYVRQTAGGVHNVIAPWAGEGAQPDRGVASPTNISHPVSEVVVSLPSYLPTSSPDSPVFSE